MPPERIPALIGAMDVLVHASLREGLARALPQALIAGKPVISYDVDGAREVVMPGETGYLLAPRSVEPLAEALVRLAQDRDAAATTGARRSRAIHGPVSTRDHDPSIARSLPATGRLRGPASGAVGPPIFRLCRACGRLEGTRAEPKLVRITWLEHSRTRKRKSIRG